MTLENKIIDFEDFAKIKGCATDVHRVFYESLERKGLYESRADFERQYAIYKNGNKNYSQ